MVALRTKDHSLRNRHEQPRQAACVDRSQTRVPRMPNRALIEFLEKISSRLRPNQTLGEVFSQAELEEVASEFNLVDADWVLLCWMIQRQRQKNDPSLD
jgi:hypothetical protein